MDASSSPYEPPRVLTLLQKALTIPRHEYSTDFSTLFDDTRQDNAYREGLVFLSCLIGGLLFLWGIVLLILKFNGNTVGCASGSAFLPQTETFEESSDFSESYNDETASGEDFALDDGQEFYDDEMFEGSSFQSSLPSYEGGGISSQQSETIVESIASVPSMPTKRERRTQVAFFIFSFLIILCIPLVHIFAFLPLRESANTASLHIEDMREITDEVGTSVKSISMGIDNIFRILQDLPMTEKEVCPEVDNVEIEKSLGFPISEMIEVYIQEYALVEKQTTENVNDINKILNAVEDVLEIVERTANETENYVWVIPCMMLGLFALTAFALFGVFLSWKRNSNLRLQRFLSYVNLPLLVLASVTCWAFAVVAATGTAVSSDACMSGRSDGSPEATIESILAAAVIEEDGTIYRFISAYSTGCQGNDPTQVIADLEVGVLDIVETIWQYLAAVDSTGRATLRGLCGEGNEITPFLIGFRDLAKQLTSVSRAMDSATTSLSCTRVHAIYDEAINESLCGDVASASAYGFLIFLTLGLSTMALVSLRSSWRHHIDEDKIYDESEVAENMIVDEHEEYLAYISKYKHEWEEYGGLETVLAEQRTLPEESVESASAPRSHSEVSASSSDYSSGSGSITEKQNNYGIPTTMAPVQKEEAFDPYTSDRGSISPANSEDISFLSLKEILTPKNSLSPNTRPAIVPPPLLQRSNSMDPDGSEGLPPPLLPSPHKEEQRASERSIETKEHEEDLKPASVATTSVTAVENDGCDDPDDISMVEAMSDLEPADIAKELKPPPLLARSSVVSSFRGECDESPPEDELARPERKLSNADRIMSDMDEIENLVSTTGESIDLKPPPTLSLLRSPSPPSESHGHVKFAVDCEPEPTLVQERVGRFSKTKQQRPLTPTRGNNKKMKDLASKFDSPSQSILYDL